MSVAGNVTGSDIVDVGSPAGHQSPSDAALHPRRTETPGMFACSGSRCGKTLAVVLERL